MKEDTISSDANGSGYSMRVFHSPQDKNANIANFCVLKNQNAVTFEASILTTENQKLKTVNIIRIIRNKKSFSVASVPSM